MKRIHKGLNPQFLELKSNLKFETESYRKSMKGEVSRVRGNRNRWKSKRKKGGGGGHHLSFRQDLLE